MLTMLLLLLLLGVGLALTSVCLWLGARWARIPQVSYRRALRAALVLGLFLPVLGLGLRNSEVLRAWGPGIGLALYLACLLFLVGLLLKWMFRTSFWRGLATWLPTLIAGAAMVAFVTFVVRPYLLEAFVVSANSMAPTLLGLHQVGDCSHCGRVAFVRADTEALREFAGRFDVLVEETGICGTCLQTGRVRSRYSSARPADRLLVNKLHTPRRWDLVVFRSPDGASVRWVKRLVGLPGEEVVIKDGAVWINGARVRPPAEIERLSYTRRPENWSAGDTWGTPERPARLGEGEYFVMGDFSARSMDSRTWPPGALTRAHLEGVATLIYWPPARWRVLR
jgi:signal peptidase I